MDLKALLVEAKQKVPPVLQVLQSGDETMLDIGGEPFGHGSVYIRTGCLLAVILLAHPAHFLRWKCPTSPFLVFPGERGCTFCGGLGHRITDCPKLEAMQTKQVSNLGRKDYLAHSSMDF